MHVAKPDLYHGERNKLDDWLLQFDLFFEFQGGKVAENKRVTLAASYMRGAAFKWIKPFLQQYMKGEAPDEVDAWMVDFDAFKDKIKPIFGISNEPEVARREIQRLRQHKSAADYAADFQQLAAATDWDDTALMTMFRQGLKPQVKTELMRTGASIDTLDTLVNEAIDIDVKLHELQQELKQTAPPMRQIMYNNQWHNNHPKQHRNKQNTGRRVHTSSNSNYYGPAAMDLSNINKGPEQKRWNGNKGNHQDKSKMTCYGCGKPGHMARDCRSKNKVIRQVNVLVTHDDADDEWDLVTDGMGRLMEDPETDSDDDLIEKPMTPDEVSDDSDGGIHLNIPSSQAGKKGRDPPDAPLDLTNAYNRIMSPEPYKEKRSRRKTTGEPRKKQRKHQESDKENQDPADEMDEVHWAVLDALNMTPEQRSQCGAKQRLVDSIRMYYHMPNIQDQIRNALKTQDDWEEERRHEWIEASEVKKEQLQYRPGYPTINTNPREQYNLDHRNPKHGLLSWTACTTDHCDIHYYDKVGKGHFPSTRRRCRYQWYDCVNDMCETHLWDKRSRLHFPGIEDPQAIIQMQTVYDGKCMNLHWQHCLNPECMIHHEAKDYHGFQELQPFLGQCRAPGIDPSIPSGPIH